MITGKDKVIEFIRFNEAPFWRIRKSENGAPITESDKPLTMDESVTRLERAFSLIGPGTYFLECWETEGQKKMWFKDTFQILPDNLQSAYVGAIQQSERPAQDINELVREAVEKERTRVKLEELEAKCKALEAENAQLIKEADSATDRIFQKVEPYLGDIMNALTGKTPEPAAIAGTEKTNEAQTRLEKAFELWQQHEHDTIGMVENIAKLAATDKGTYNMARNFLVKK
jgi:hypothetical protein